MKKYQKLFYYRSCPRSLASHSTVHATETPESEVKILGPTDRASNVNVTVNDRTASISIPFPSSRTSSYSPRFGLMRTDRMISNGMKHRQQLLLTLTLT